MFKRLMATVVVALAGLCAGTVMAADLKHMRAIHLGTYEKPNQQGMKILSPEWAAYWKARHVNWVGVSVAIFNDSISDPRVHVRYRPAGDNGIRTYTHDDADLEKLIKWLKDNNFKVYLTLALEDPVGNPWDVPYIDRTPLCGTDKYPVDRSAMGAPVVFDHPSFACYRKDLWWWSPSHPQHTTHVETFFSTYTDVALKYADIAQKLNVDLYSIGTETANFFRSRPTSGVYVNDFGAQLRKMVSKLKTVYKGPLTYDQASTALQNPAWYGGSDGHYFLPSDIGLDAIGISAYFTLTKSIPDNVISVDALKQAWRDVFTGILLPLKDRNPGQPIIFLEFAYVNDVGSPGNPANNLGPVVYKDQNSNGLEDGDDQQINILSAFYAVNKEYDDLVGGQFYWGNFLFPVSNMDFQWSITHRDFPLYGRPALNLVSEVYRDWKNKEVILDGLEADLAQYLSPHASTEVSNGFVHRCYKAVSWCVGIKDGGVYIVNTANGVMNRVFEEKDILALYTAR